MSAQVAEVVWYNEDSVSPLTVSKPAAFASGEMLVAVIAQHAPSSQLNDMTAPTGWTQRGSYSETNNQAKIFTIVFTGGLPSTWDFPYYVNADVCLGLFRITGADTTPTLVIATTTFASLTGSTDSPTVTPTGADDLLLCLLANTCNAATFSSTDPSGMTDRGQTQAATNFMGLAAASQQLASGSATGAKTWTSVSPTGVPGGSISIAIKSAAAAAVALPARPARIRVKPLMPQRQSVVAVAPGPQQNPPMPRVRVSQPRLIRLLRGRRTRTASPVPPQVNPPIGLPELVQPRRLRGLIGWRTRLGRIPLVGAAPAAPPPLPPPLLRHAARPIQRPRRTNIVAPASPQQTAARAITPPRRLPRGLPRWRSRTAAPVQHTPALPPRSPMVPRRLRGLRPTPRRNGTPLSRPSNPPLPLKAISAPRRWPRGFPRWRTRLGRVPLVGLGSTQPGSGTVLLPTGLIPVRTFTTAEILTGNRFTRFRFDLYSRLESALGNLDGVKKGSVDFTSSASVHSGGALEVVDTGQAVDWLNDRVRPVVIIEGLEEIPLGMFVFSEAPEDWGDTGRMWPVKLLDKTSILDQDAVDVTYALDAGTVITTAVVTLIASTGETNIAVTPSAATLSGPLTWPAGTTKLKIVNDLLSAAGYFSLFCDGNGQYRGQPYVRPAARPIRYEFLDGAQSIYSPDFVKDVDLFAIPNKFIAVGQGDAATAALTSTATNTDPDSPYSFAARGRWITKSATGVEAADQTVLDDYARRRLIELTSPTSSIDVSHMFVPDLTFNDAVRLRRVPAGVDARHVVTKMVVTFDATALVKSSLQEVVDL